MSHWSTRARFSAIHLTAWPVGLLPWLTATLICDTSTTGSLTASNSARAAGLALRKSLLAVTRMSAATQPILHRPLGSPAADGHWSAPMEA